MIDGTKPSISSSGSLLDYEPIVKRALLARGIDECHVNSRTPEIFIDSHFSPHCLDSRSLRATAIRSDSGMKERCSSAIRFAQRPCRLSCLGIQFLTPAFEVRWRANHSRKLARAALGVVHSLADANEIVPPIASRACPMATPPSGIPFSPHSGSRRGRPGRLGRLCRRKAMDNGPRQSGELEAGSGC